MRILILCVAILALSPLVLAEEVTTEEAPSVFHEPIQLMADGKPIAMESPGFAAPTVADVDGDGKRDLVVGQFKSGKMHFFKNIGSATAPEFAAGDWIKTGDKAAIVPDVW